MRGAFAVAYFHRKDKSSVQPGKPLNPIGQRSHSACCVFSLVDIVGGQLSGRDQSQKAARSINKMHLPIESSLWSYLDHVINQFQFSAGECSPHGPKREGHSSYLLSWPFFYSFLLVRVVVNVWNFFYRNYAFFIKNSFLYTFSIYPHHCSSERITSLW